MAKTDGGVTRADSLCLPPVFKGLTLCFFVVLLFNFTDDVVDGLVCVFGGTAVVVVVGVFLGVVCIAFGEVFVVEYMSLVGVVLTLNSFVVDAPILDACVEAALNAFVVIDGLLEDVDVLSDDLVVVLVVGNWENLVEDVWPLVMDVFGADVVDFTLYTTVSRVDEVGNTGSVLPENPGVVGSVMISGSEV